MMSRSLPPARRRRRVRQDVSLQQALWTLFPSVALTYSFFLPMEVRIEIGGQSLYLYRLVMLVSIPWLIIESSRVEFKFNIVDGLFSFAAFWMVFSFGVFYESLEGALRGLALAIDVILPYFIFRHSIKNLKSFRYYLIIVAPGFFVSGLIVALESISHTYLAKPLASQIFGSRAVYADGQAVGELIPRREIRFGLMRGAGPYPHPILAGMTLASVFPLYIYSGIKGWPKVIGIIAGAFAVFSMSSGAFLLLLIGVSLILYDRLSLNSLFNWWHAIFAGSILLLAIEVISPNGAFSVFIRYTLDPQTGYYRQLIWEFGLKSVFKHPFIGIGFTDFERLSWMVNSIDAHWLLMSVRHGAIPAILQFACLITIIVQISKCSSWALFDYDRNCFRAIVFVVFAMIVGGMTVSFYGQTSIWLYAFIGMAVTLMNSAFPKVRQSSRRL